MSDADSFTLFGTVFSGSVSVRGRGLTICHGWQDSARGPVHIGLSRKGICWIGLETRDGRAESEHRLRAWWPAARFAAQEGNFPDIDALDPGMPLDLHGTAFHLRVWRALAQVPQGQTCTYGDLARAIGAPSAFRAVGGAVGANPVSLLIPCHRVLPSGGSVGNYGWGPEVKRVLLAGEGVKV